MEDYRWKEFEMRVEAYRFYLNIALQTNVFFYAITGVVLGFYLKEAVRPYLVLTLLLPILIAAVLGGVFLHAADLQKDAADLIDEIGRDLWGEGARVKEIPDLELLYVLLYVFGRIFFVVGVALIATPLLNADSWWPLPSHLCVFLLTGCAILAVAGRWTLWFARRHYIRARALRPCRPPEKVAGAAGPAAGK